MLLPLKSVLQRRLQFSRVQVMLLRRLRHQKHQLVKHLQRRQVRQQAQHLDLDQADHVQVTIHLHQHRVHRVLETIHLLQEVPDHVQAAA